MVTVPTDLDVIEAPHGCSPTPALLTGGETASEGAADVFAGVTR